MKSGMIKKSGSIISKSNRESISNSIALRDHEKTSFDMRQ